MRGGIAITLIVDCHHDIVIDLMAAPMPSGAEHRCPVANAVPGATTHEEDRARPILVRRREDVEPPGLAMPGIRHEGDGLPARGPDDVAVDGRRELLVEAEVSPNVSASDAAEVHARAELLVLDEGNPLGQLAVKEGVALHQFTFRFLAVPVQSGHEHLPATMPTSAASVLAASSAANCATIRS